MNFIREVVGGPKNRYKSNGFNLDLTYITKKIIAMAFPASGIQKIYRNSIDAVAELLQKNHKQKYIIVNISGRDIEEKKFHNVKSYDWQDHKSPPIDLLFEICWTMCQFLSSDLQNVVVIHCNHGKGRTGTLISCFLLFVKAFETPEEAMSFYSKRRFETQGLGVSQPCQIQYIKYFYMILTKKHFPKPICLTKIMIKQETQLNNPYYKVFDILEKKQVINTREKQLAILEIQKQNQYTILFKEKFLLVGDIKLDIKHATKIGKNIIGSYSFNTAFFTQNEGVVEVKKSELSPLSVVKGSGVSENFKVYLSYKRFCKCKNIEQIPQKCQICLKVLKREQKIWAGIYQIIEKIQDLKNFEELRNLEQNEKEKQQQEEEEYKLKRGKTIY